MAISEDILNQNLQKAQAVYQETEQRLQEMEKNLGIFQKENQEFCRLFWGKLPATQEMSHKERLELFSTAVRKASLKDEYRQLMADRKVLEGTGVSLITFIGILSPAKSKAMQEAYFTGANGKSRNPEEISAEYKRLREKLKKEAVDPEAFDRVANIKKKTGGKAGSGVTGDIKAGEMVTFGRYPQTEKGNDQTPIKWKVLKVKDGKALLISEKGLDSKPYNVNYSDVTWETCTLRKWLNAEFLGKAFSTEEQKLIPQTRVTADENPDYSTNPGRDTTDRVFLLSINEANRYFASGQSRQCAPTAYAKAQGEWTSDDYKTAGGEAACWWWLRSPGFSQKHAATVCSGGSVSSGGRNVDSDYGCVRPALWIDLES